MEINVNTLNPVRVTMTLAQRAALQERAAREGTSVSELVRRAVDAMLVPQKGNQSGR
jgi:hypothetical protein